MEYCPGVNSMENIWELFAGEFFRRGVILHGEIVWGGCPDLHAELHDS